MTHELAVQTIIWDHDKTAFEIKSVGNDTPYEPMIRQIKYISDYVTNTPSYIIRDVNAVHPTIADYPDATNDEQYYHMPFKANPPNSDWSDYFYMLASGQKDGYNSPRSVYLLYANSTIAGRLHELSNLTSKSGGNYYFAKDYYGYVWSDPEYLAYGEGLNNKFTSINLVDHDSWNMEDISGIVIGTQPNILQVYQDWFQTSGPDSGQYLQHFDNVTITNYPGQDGNRVWFEVYDSFGTTFTLYVHFDPNEDNCYSGWYVDNAYYGHYNP